MDCAEYSLAELIDDPLVGLVMKSDGVNRAELKRLLERVARAIARDSASKPLWALSARDGCNR
jgi:hypothetical protein